MTRIIARPGAWRELSEVWRPDPGAVAVIGDHTVTRLFRPRLEPMVDKLAKDVHFLSFPPGDPHKTRAEKERLEDRMLALGIGRDGLVIGLGGGVSLDLAGFVAATYMRGIPSLYLPTTLLAQVDAAIGGKTGVNTSHGKNLIGAFHPPLAILADPETLESLPEAEWRNGLAEMVKTAVAADESLFLLLESRTKTADIRSMACPKSIRRCMTVKTDIVRQDEREHGLRAVLNFGHSIGHALETLSEHRISHGEAVAAGMLAECRIAEILCGFPRSESERIGTVLRGIGFDLRLPFDSRRILETLRTDKKNRAGEIRMALPERIGRMAGNDNGHTLSVSPELLKKVLESSAPARS